LGLSGETISYPNRAPAEIDFYAGIRRPFGNLGLDFGAWYCWYTDGDCFHNFLPDCLPSGTPYPSYTNWNVGFAFTSKQFTLDLRYSDTNVINYDIARIPNVTVNPGLATDHCPSTFIGKLGRPTKDDLR
jgi:hypothetical protein